ncbi:MAG: carbohydrate ABC transporter permease [Clostridiales bacterium]|nr:carbohydrate ABC transporter permease [Clostridiales bacterium]
MKKSVLKLKRGQLSRRIELLDIIIFVFMIAITLAIILPFINVIAISLSTQKDFMDSRFMLIPKKLTFGNYKAILQDNRIWIGYRTTLIFLALGVPLNMILTTSMAYGLSRPGFPLRRFFVYFIIFTMMFNGGIIPLYLVMRQLKLINTIWSVILGAGLNSFYLIIMRNYFMSLPPSLMESARLDGANEWQILLNIIIPISMPIIATITLFYSVDRWNEWYFAMIFIRKNDLVSLQLALRSIVMDNQASQHFNISDAGELKFSDGMKMGAVLCTMLPIMCVFPFLQKHFVKGILLGAIKA